jgi:hypothetical protein
MAGYAFFKYVFSHRPKLSSLLKISAVHMILLVFLSWMIAGVDLYLHTATKAISMNFTTAIYQDQPIDTLESFHPLHPGSITLPASLGNFGGALNTSFCQGASFRPGVFDVEGLPKSSCSVIDVNTTSVPESDQDFKVGQSIVLIVGLQKAIQVYNNQSDSFRVYTVDGVSILGPASIDQQVDFRASTLGVKTQCQSLINVCNFTSGNGTNPTFECPIPGQNLPWPGEFVQVGIAAFDNPVNAPPNTFQFGTIVKLDVQSPSLETGKIAVLGGDLVRFEDGFWVTIQLCTSTVLTVDYIYYSNTSTFVLDQTIPGDTNLTRNVRHPFLSANSIVLALVQYAAQVGVSTSDNYLESYSDQLSRFTIALASGVVMNTPSRSEAWWETQIITRVPLYPLLLLEFLLLVYALLGIILVTMAAITNRKSSRAEHQNKPHELDHFAGTTRIPPAEVIHTRLIDPTSLVLNELFDDVSGMRWKLIVLAENANRNKRRSILKLLDDPKIREPEELALLNTTEPSFKADPQTQETELK